MLRRARFLIATVLLIGCGSGSAKKDGGPDAGGATGSGGATGAGGSGNTAGTTGAGGTGTGGTGTGGSGTGGSGTAGIGVPTGTSVFTGNQAVLLDLGPPCMNEIDATGDRWCGFLAASVTIPNNGDLFVVNVTKAAAGTAITCGLTDPNCLLLTSSFGEDDFHIAGFLGDTLVYYDLTATPFGWRPGMTAGRALAVADPATADVLGCTPDSKGTAIVCLRDLPVAMQTDPNLIISDILVGKLDDAATPPLVTLDRVISFNRGDGSVPRFQMGFPIPGGDTIAWSARATATGPEILKAQTMGNDASRVTVAMDVNDWTASLDGSHWYWRSMVSATTFAGTLQSATYPSGANPVTILASTVQYDFPTPATLLAVDTGMRMLNFADPFGAPTASQSLDTGVLAFVAVSSKAHVVYVKQATTSASGQTFSDLYVKKSDGTGACTLATTTNALPFPVVFPPAAGGLIWVQRAITSVQEQYTRLSDCTLTSVAMNVSGIGAIGDRAVLYANGFSTTSMTFSMWFRNLTGDTLTSDPASRISSQVGSFTVAKSGTSDLVVYTVNGGTNADGVYVRSFGP